jgi:hypothetical protein
VAEAASGLEHMLLQISPGIDRVDDCHLCHED